jgi:FixJ family two-component response regulator
VTTGLTLLRKDLRGAFPGRTENDKRCMQVIVVTGYSSDSDFVIRVMQEGADDFIVKPFDADLTRVADKISNCLRHSGRVAHGDCAAQTKAAAIARESVPRRL